MNKKQRTIQRELKRLAAPFSRVQFSQRGIDQSVRERERVTVVTAHGQRAFQIAVGAAIPALGANNWHQSH